MHYSLELSAGRTINPFVPKEFLHKLSSGSKILFTITFELRMILQNI